MEGLSIAVGLGLDDKFVISPVCGKPVCAATLAPLLHCSNTQYFMRRFLTIVLMLVLALQATWSVAASVCRHDVALEAPHFGHHEHADDAAQAGEAQDATAGVAVPHLDCVGCHGGLASALLGDIVAVDAVPLRGGVATPYQRSITHGLPERLIRPPHFFLT
jgi:hypothetical protein